MINTVLATGREIVRAVTATPGRRHAARYLLSLTLVAALFAIIPHTPLEGPVGGVFTLVCVLVCCWFCGPGPALLMPLVIWTISRIVINDPPRPPVPTSREIVTFFAISMLTGAMGLAGQYQRRLRAATRLHDARMREQSRALSHARILFRDFEGRISGWNDGAQQLYGWTSADAAGQVIHELLQTTFPLPLEDVRRQLASTGQWHGEVTQHCQDGSELIVATHYILYAGTDGSPSGVAEIHNDVTDLRRAEAAIRESDRRKDLFVATLAHELRNPLAPLRSGIDILRLSRTGGDDSDGILDIMQRQLEHIVRMVDDLLDVSRINTGKVVLRRSRVLLADIVRDAVESCRTQLDEARHELEVSLPEHPVEFDADSARLVQVLVNLLSNSAKFTPPGGRIRLTAEHSGAHVTIRVRDNGPGIRPEALPKIFDMFAQVEDVHRRSAGGLGLGLNIVRTLVEMHGGTVTAHSDGPGCGAEFTLRLPATCDRSITPALEIKTSPVHFAASRRVLVVDDNQDAARTLALMLTNVGFDCRHAFDGPSALTLAEEFDPHAVVLDLGMPGMDGLQVARSLRTNSQANGAVLIALTGWDKDEDRRVSQEAGFDHHLAKPVRIDTLVSLLHAQVPQTSAAS